MSQDHAMGHAAPPPSAGGVTLEEQVDVLISAAREAGRLAAEVDAQEHRRDAAPRGYLRRECTRELSRRRKALTGAERWLAVERDRVLTSRRS